MNKLFVANIKSGAAGTRQLTYIISTKSADRDNDRILSWDLSNYRKNPVVLFAHDYQSLPIGKTTSINQVGDALVATVEFAPADLWPVAEQCYQLASQGFMSGASVGFRPVGAPKANELGGYDYSKAELLEWSLVPVPTNTEALRRAAKAAVSRSYVGAPDVRRIIEASLDRVESLSKGGDLSDAEIVTKILDTVEAAKANEACRLDAAVKKALDKFSVADLRRLGGGHTQ